MNTLFAITFAVMTVAPFAVSAHGFIQARFGTSCMQKATTSTVIAAKLINILASIIIAFRKPSFVIGSIDDPHLKRWRIFPTNSRFNIYLHEYFGPDDSRALHDHPWSSASLCLRGELFDITRNGLEVVSVGDIVWRDATTPHRIGLPDGMRGQRTLFIIGNRQRDWGFHCHAGWIPWQRFTNRTNGNSTVGAGCDG